MAEPARWRESGVDNRFESLYRGHHRQILAYFIRRIPPSDAEDAAAEVFTVAWRRLDHVPQGEQAVGWLYGVAHKVLSNHRRSWGRALRLNRRLGSLGTPPVETPEIQVVRSVEDQMLIRALQQLRQPDREILMLATWEKLAHGSIGELLDISGDAVGQRISRARKRLAKELERIENRQRVPVPAAEKKGGLR